MPLLDAQGRPTEGGEEKTEGGLVVPKGTIPRQERTISNCDWKNIRRTVKKLVSMDVGTRLMCMKCSTIMEPMGNELALQCQCSTWRIKAC